MGHAVKVKELFANINAKTKPGIRCFSLLCINCVVCLFSCSIVDLNVLVKLLVDALTLLCRYMWNPLSWAMEAAAILAIALLDYADFALIVGLLILNATISYVEESNADKAIKALTAALAPKAKALRDGQVLFRVIGHAREPSNIGIKDYILLYCR